LMTPDGCLAAEEKISSRNGCVYKTVIKARKSDERSSTLLLHHADEYITPAHQTTFSYTLHLHIFRHYY